MNTHDIKNYIEPLFLREMLNKGWKIRDEDYMDSFNNDFCLSFSYMHWLNPNLLHFELHSSKLYKVVGDINAHVHLARNLLFNKKNMLELLKQLDKIKDAEIKKVKTIEGLSFVGMI